MENIAQTLEWNAREVRFGTVSVEVHIHDGRIVKTVYSTTNRTLEKEEVRNERT